MAGGRDRAACRRVAVRPWLRTVGVRDCGEEQLARVPQLHDNGLVLIRAGRVLPGKCAASAIAGDGRGARHAGRILAAAAVAERRRPGSPRKRRESLGANLSARGRARRPPRRDADGRALLAPSSRGNPRADSSRASERASELRASSRAQAGTRRSGRHTGRRKQQGSEASRKASRRCRRGSRDARVVTVGKQPHDRSTCRSHHAREHTHTLRQVWFGRRPA